MWRNYDQNYSARDSDQSSRQSRRCGSRSTMSVYLCNPSSDTKCNLPTCARPSRQTQSSSDRMRTVPMLSWNDNSCSHGQNCSVHGPDQSSRQNHRCDNRSTMSACWYNPSSGTICNSSMYVRRSRQIPLPCDRMKTAPTPSSNDNSCSRGQNCSARGLDSLFRQNRRCDSQSTMSAYSCNPSNDTKCNLSTCVHRSKQTLLPCDRMKMVATLSSNDNLNNRGRSCSPRDSGSVAAVNAAPWQSKHCVDVPT